MADSTNEIEISNSDYFFVRALGDRFDVFFDNSVVAVGWSDTPFNEYTNADCLVSIVREGYRGKSPQFVGRLMNQIRYFKNLNDGDRIIVPFYDSIRLATVSGHDELYDEAQVDTTDLANQRRVNYVSGDDGNLLTIPRSDLSEGLAKRLRMPGTAVGNLWEFSDEIENLFENRSGWSATFPQKHKELGDNFKRQLLDNLRHGKTNLEAGGIGLEKLVVELLQLEGYAAKKLPTNKFPDDADADIQASRVDRFTEDYLLVQAKHHEGVEDAWPAKQVLNAGGTPGFENHKLVVVTTAQPDGELTEMCEEEDIVLIDGELFVEWLYEHIDKLSAPTRRKLGISEVPSLIE